MLIRTIPLVLLAGLAAGCIAKAGSLDDDEATAPGDDALTSTLSELETSGGWTTCSTSGSNCGGANGMGTPVQSTFTTGSFAGRASAARIWIGGGVRYGEAYWYKKTAGPSYQVAELELSTDFYIPAGASYEAIEWDPQQVRSQHVFNFGWQAANSIGQWRVYDYGAHQWQDSGVAWTGLAEGAWHTFRAHYHTSGQTIVYDWMEIDGARHAVTQHAEHAAVYKASYTGNDLSLGLQLDQKSSGASYSVDYDHVSLTYSDTTGGSSGSSGGGGGGGACVAPSILEPSAGQSVGPAIRLRVSAPACLDAVKCYLDGNPAPVASTSGAVDQWVSVSMGGHAVQCNGWEPGGAVHPSASVSFTRTY
ncbi:MAG TPA: hypothetical protein VHB21_10275 [Minicystis sp.]|nr:hypothetical protein [Minicystis sp.]